MDLLSGSGFKKDVLWNIVREMGISVSEIYSANPEDYDIIMVDSSGGKGTHIWYTFIGLNSITGKMFPLHHSVGVSMKEIKPELEATGVVKKIISFLSMPSWAFTVNSKVIKFSYAHTILSKTPVISFGKTG